MEGVAAIPGLLAGAAVASGVVHLEPRAGHDACENMGKSEGWLMGKSSRHEGLI